MASQDTVEKYALDAGDGILRAACEKVQVLLSSMTLNLPSVQTLIDTEWGLSHASLLGGDQELDPRTILNLNFLKTLVPETHKSVSSVCHWENCQCHPTHRGIRQDVVH